MDLETNSEAADKTDGGASSRVHFNVDRVQQHDAAIVVKSESDSRISVHLGFLELHHVYEIKFSIKDKLNEDIEYDPLENLHTKISDYAPSEDGEGHDLILDLCAHKEKLMREELHIWDSQVPTQRITLVVQARVLGKGKGTPMLKRGIRCTAITADEDSEQSDWQGFD